MERITEKTVGKIFIPKLESNCKVLACQKHAESKIKIYLKLGNELLNLIMYNLF